MIVMDNPSKKKMTSKRLFPFDESRKEHKKRNMNSTSHEKISKLLSALEGLLDEDGLDEVEALIGKAAFLGATELQNVLRNQEKAELKSNKPSVEPPSRESVNRNVGRSISNLQLTPWTSSSILSELPPLPAVFDPTLEVAAFTHHGYGSGRISDLSYERLEWVGDAYIYITSTLLISQTFPAFLPGKCSQLRERLVKNVTLADYAHKYGFDKRAKLPESLLPGAKYSSKDQDNTKVMGDIFEAYVAAVVLSDPMNGVARASEWLKSLWAMKLSKEIKQEERIGKKLDSPMWNLRGAVDVQANQVSEVTYNSKEKLQQALASKISKLTYKDIGSVRKDPETKLPVFTVGVFLTGWGEVDKQIGYGSANGKKEAGMKAADMALQNKKMMSMYLGKRKIYDAQQEKERTALEKLEGNCQ
ncbi:hypothetical protein DSL72_006095 [Monilinia vaccinii-corymbosi]|uniref:RNase III domain-containing protein n=1 Tax=Monilinia vaccinii-corymbosi TaxID=61207 RepID=A0A8A3PHN4_9HELO|nr:hypothetical protein DSL72_006095 [Monilinia vaccinii-corymbosi]